MNYIEGFVQPLQNAELPGDVKFKIWFKNGNTTVFLKVMRFLLKELREESSFNKEDQNNKLIEFIKTDEFNKKYIGNLEPNEATSSFIT